MVRSLWTGATGMIAQQNNIDTIANNLSNVNTTGYKTEVNEFKSLLYQNVQTRTTSANGDTKPVGAQVGLGVRNASITSLFKQGSLLASDSNSAFAVEGSGFFQLRGEDGNVYYTRNGDFRWSIANGGGLVLTSSDGYPVLDETGNAIALPAGYMSSRISVLGDGTIAYPDEDNNLQPLGISIGLVQFNNPSGLEKVGGTMYQQTAASGVPVNEATSNAVEKSNIVQGYLEGSNVQVADEMVNMIVAQRAYEMNSKIIQASDQMLEQANNLRR